MFPLTMPQRQVYNSEKYYGGAIGRLCGGILLRRLVPEEDLSAAADTLFRVNDALRLRLAETPDGPMQFAAPYAPCRTEILRFSSREELDAYADAWTKEPFGGDAADSTPGEGGASGESGTSGGDALPGADRPLCDMRLVYLPDRCGILVKLDHMVGDEWSFLLLASQTCAFLRGEEPRGGSYLDYAAAENIYIRSGKRERDRAWALEQFREREEPAYLSDRPDGSPESARLSFSLDAAQSSSIRTQAAEWGVTPYVLFLTALAVTVSRMRMNAERFYLGTVIRGRRTAAEKRTAGMFVSTAALPVALDYSRSFRENAALMRGGVTAALRHQRFNYEMTRQAVQQEYGFDGRFFDTLLSYQSGAVRDGGDAETFWAAGGVQAEALQLHVSDHDSRGAFQLDYDYQTAKFTAGEIAALHGRFTRILFDGTASGDKRPAELSLLSEAEQEALAALNDTAAEYDRTACVHTLIERQAARTPDAPALTDVHGTLTYGQFNALANRAAHALAAGGVGPGDFIAFSLPRDRRILIAMLGILKTGAAYLPIDPDFPEERIQHILQESRAKVYLTAESFDGLFGGDSGAYLTAESAENLAAVDGGGNPDVPVPPEAPCYAIYTSGSTGVPKGALMSHRGIVDLMSVNRCNPVPTAMAGGAVRRVASVGSVIFDLFGAETLLPLSLGLETVLADEEQSRSQRALNELLSRTPAQAMLLTPTKLKSLMVDPDCLRYLREMRMIVLGGESLESDLVKRLHRLTDADIYNGYGPAEAMWSTYGKIDDPDDINIGAPLANTRIHIVDRFLNQLPVGVAGEICIAGDVVGPGYLNNPERTAERFLPNPFGPGTLYRTGDLGRWRADGRIDFLGRNDFQVKLRGIRVEPGEIELALRELPGVQDAAVGVRPDSRGRQTLCAWFTGAALSPGYLRRALAMRLPRNIVPQSYVHMDAFPHTASGKLDRRALPDPAPSSQDGTDYAPPVGGTEEMLCAAMEKALGCEKIGRDDDFFDRGGDSLRLLELLAMLEEAGRRVQLKTLLENTTPRSLARALDEPAGSVPG